MRASAQEVPIRDPHRLAAYAFALLVGALAAHRAFPAPDLLGHLPIGVPDNTDLLQHLTGQLYFLAEPWHADLLRVRRLDAPGGTNIGLTDSIPLAAVLLKLAGPLLPAATRQAVGPFLGLAWLLQPVAAVYALRATAARGLVASAAVAVLAAEMPFFLHRANHAALDAHFLLFAALGLALRGRVVALAVLVPVALFIHPYLMAMVAAVACAVPLTLWSRNRRRDAGRAAVLVAGAIAATAVLAKLAGYLGGTGLRGYGFYSMNLASPFWPVASSLFPHVPAAAADATGGQYEGEQYAGAGTLLLLFLLLASARGRRVLRGMAQRHVGLIAVSAALAAFAVTPVAFFLHHLVLYLAWTPPGGGALRASGRMFWPVSDLLLLAVVAATVRSFGRAAPALLAFAAALQFADMATTREAVRDGRYLYDRPPTPVFSTLEWVTGAYAAVAIEPRLECDATDADAAMAVVFTAARRALPVNTMYAARPDPADRCDPAHDPALLGLAPGVLGVATGRGAAAKAARWAAAGARCGALGPYALCSASGTRLETLTSRR